MARHKDPYSFEEWRPIPKLPTSIQQQALCKKAPIDWFYPNKGHLAIGKRLCNNCPVQQQCLEYALEHAIHYGVWGGKSERQRHTIRQQRKTQQHQKTHQKRRDV